MDKMRNMPEFELIYIVVDYKMGSKVLHAMKKYGIRGGTVFHGKGTIHNAFLNFLSLYEQRKEIVMIGTDSKTADYALDMLNKEFRFDRPNRGIVFTTSLNSMVGTHQTCDGSQEKEVINPMYQFIITIVEKGKAEDVIDSATSAGSKGGTIVNARGSGIHETDRIFNMDIEPEKEMVFIVSKKETTDIIVEAIRKKLDIEKPGQGVIFVQDVNRTYGVYE